MRGAGRPHKSVGVGCAASSSSPPAHAAAHVRWLTCGRLQARAGAKSAVHAVSASKRAGRRETQRPGGEHWAAPPLRFACLPLPHKRAFSRLPLCSALCPSKGANTCPTVRKTGSVMEEEPASPPYCSLTCASLSVPAARPATVGAALASCARAGERPPQRE